MATLLGQTVGRYHVERELGSGGMGEVFLGVHPTIGSRVAIKVLNADSARDEDVCERFFTEARAVNTIRHDNIVQVLDLDRLPDGRPYIVMEYLEGLSLAQAMAHLGPLPLESLGRVGEESLDALAAAHRHGIVHRDLKPDNIQITTSGRTKLLDFGIAKLMVEGVQTRTATGMLLGTPHYMAPEQISAGAIDARTDLYALGIILYEAATGQKPFDGGTLFELFNRHINEAPVAPRQLRPELPPLLEALICRALEKDPARRFGSAKEMGAYLAQAVEGPPTEGRRRTNLVEAVAAGASPARQATAWVATGPPQQELASAATQWQPTPQPATGPATPQEFVPTAQPALAPRLAPTPRGGAAPQEASLPQAVSPAAPAPSFALPAGAGPSEPASSTPQPVAAVVPTPQPATPASPQPASRVALLVAIVLLVGLGGGGAAVYLLLGGEKEAPSRLVARPALPSSRPAGAEPPATRGEASSAPRAAASDPALGGSDKAKPRRRPKRGRASRGAAPRESGAPPVKGPAKAAPKAAPKAPVTSAPKRRVIGGVTFINTGNQVVERHKPPKNTRAFDPIAFYPRAYGMVRKYAGDARLTSIDVNGVKPDGLADLSLAGSYEASYQFRSPSVSGSLDKRVPEEDRKEVPCLLYVDVSPRYLRVRRVGDDSCNQRFVTPPHRRWSLKKAWQIAIKSGEAGKNRIATVMWDNDGWYLNFGATRGSVTIKKSQL